MQFLRALLEHSLLEPISMNHFFLSMSFAQKMTENQIYLCL
jgi:hypothetical protein